jgi:hypothetical protein
MRKKIVAFLIIMLMSSLSMSSTVIAGDEENPEVVDKIFDVKLFGTFPFFPQMFFKNADFKSVWFYEEGSNPEYLYICMKLRELQTSSDEYDFIYVVDWTYNDVSYGASIHLLPTGLTSYISGTFDEEGNHYLDYVVCEGDFDDTTSIITWIVPKENIGNPMKGNKITNIVPHTHIRFPLDSGRVKFDLFKDLPWNALITKDYTIEY